jgi:hypothetical protein
MLKFWLLFIGWHPIPLMRLTYDMLSPLTSFTQKMVSVMYGKTFQELQQTTQLKPSTHYISASLSAFTLAPNV